MKIRSNKALKYNCVKCLEGIIELKIIDVREFPESQLCVVSVQDSVISEGAEGNEVAEVINIRPKELPFSQLDGLEAVLSGEIEDGSYMEERAQLLQAGLLYITQNDPKPIYFSESADWEAV